MDPGILAMLTMISHPVGAVIAAGAGLSGFQHFLAGHSRGDHQGAVQTWVVGGLLAGSVYTAPRWIPSLVAAAQAVNFF